MDKLPLNFRDERQMRSTIGLGEKSFSKLLEVFSVEFDAFKEEEYQQQIANGTRKRKPGGGRKSKLKTAADKLAYGLYYLKNYPTYDVLAEKFDLSRSVAHDNVNLILPIISTSLDELEVLPKREFKDAEEFQQYFKDKNIETLIIDVTEREHFRYIDKDKRDALWSGKKKNIP